MKHRHNGPKVKYRTKRNNIRYRKRPIHSQSLIRKHRPTVRRMAWDIERAKEELHKIEYMSPEEYIKKTGLNPDDFPIGWSKDYFYDTEKEEIRPIEELGEYIESPTTKVRIPFVDEFGEHEGRHRAYAALLKGEKEIPVAVPLERSERKELAEEFIQRAFPDSHKTYQDEWMERFESGFPESRMDKERRKIYEEILEERNIEEPE